MTASHTYLDQLPADARYVGDASAGEIEITSRPGSPAGNGGSRDTGVVYEDEYILVVRDAVRFPSGASGTYLRIFTRSALDGPAGVMILGSRGGSLALRRMFRHATRQWELEAPRGARSNGSPSQAARKELVEEIGLDARALERIGEVWPDTGLLSASVVVFWAELDDGHPVPSPEDREALGEIVFLDRDALRTEIGAGRLRDGITLAAITLAQVAGKLAL